MLGNFVYSRAMQCEKVRQLIHLVAAGWNSTGYFVLILPNVIKNTIQFSKFRKAQLITSNISNLVLISGLILQLFDITVLQSLTDGFNNPPRLVTIT